MRLSTVFTLGLSLASSLVVLASPVGEPTEPEIIVVTTFPEDNPFQHVTNGEKNSLLVGVENKSDKNVTITTISGAITHPDTGKLVKNTTTLTYGVPLLEGAKISLPYNFYSEFKPGDHRLQLWLEHVNGEDRYRVEAFNSVISVVEPPLSVFDIKLLLTYLIVLGLVGGAGYFAYLTYVPQPKGKKIRADIVSEPVGVVTATGAGGYQEEWIPANHLKKERGANRRKSGAVTSGDETSGAELSGAESTKRKGKGRK